MHQGLTTRLILCMSLLFATTAIAQLSTSDEVIETIEDIQIKDDTSSKKKDTNPNKPQYDEEFGKKQPVVEDKIEEAVETPEENIAEPESSPQEQQKAEEQATERRDIEDGKKGSYEDELEKNARRNRFERKEISPEDLKNFEVDPVEQQRLEKQAKPEAPKAPAPIESEDEFTTDEPSAEEPFVATPTEEIPKEEQLAPKDEIDQEISDIKAEEEEEAPRASLESKPTEITPEEPAGAAIQYEPEVAGPVINYENERKFSDDQLDTLSEKTKVEIEEDPFVEGTNTKKIGDYLKPYKDRRPEWTSEFGIGVSQYTPENYWSEVNTLTDDFETFYEPNDVPTPELSYEFKRNYSWAAISLGASVAYYSVSNEVADFTLTMPSIFATLYLDTLFDEPYVVPYATVGYTYMMFDEAPIDGSEGFKGETDNIFIGAGVLFQLDWLDPISDSIALQDMGIQNTFVYVEGRTFLDQGIARANDDADFSSSTHVAGGVKLEF